MRRMLAKAAGAVSTAGRRLTRFAGNRSGRNDISDSVRVIARRSPLACVNPCAIEGLEDRTVFSGSLAHGIDLTTLSGSNYNAVLSMLRDTGTHSVRAWVSVNNYSSRSDDGTWKYFRKMHSAGIDFVISVVPRNGLHGSASQISGYFSWLAGKLGGISNKWEIGNEVDRSGYGGHLGDYVNQLLKPAAGALHAHGIKVISGSVSWNPDDIKALVNAGMLNYVDYVGYHPYRNNVAQLQSAISAVKSYVHGKPLIATEWNARGQSGSAAWTGAIKAFWPYIRDNFYAAYYYAAQKANTMAGAAGVLVNNSGAHNGAYYSTFKALGGGGSGSVAPAPSTSTTAAAKPAATVSIPTIPKVTTPASTGKTQTTGTTTIKAPVKATPVKATPVKSTPVKSAPAPTGPTVSYLRILDAKTGKVLSGFDHVDASATIKLKALPTRFIQIEAVAAKAGSVKFTFTGQAGHTENTAAYTAFVDRSGKYAGWEAGVGSYTVTATAYSKAFASGTKGNRLGLTLAFR